MKFARSLIPGQLFQSKIQGKIRLIIFVVIVLIIFDYFGILLHLFEVSFEKFRYPLDIPVQEMLSAAKTGAKLPYKPINEYNYLYTLKNEGKCLTSDAKELEKVVLLYVVKSAVNHQSRRTVIRETWGWEKRFSDVIIRKIFMLGLPQDSNLQDEINKENEKHKDIVQANFIDAYYNNTIKTILSFKWVIQYCSKAQFIIFSDDDMYISTKNMLKFIRNPFKNKVGFKKKRSAFLEDSFDKETVSNINLTVASKSEFQILFQNRKLTYDPVLSAFDGRLFAGYVFTSSPMRHKFSKWYVSLSDYPYSKYPPYVTAGAYVLSYPALEDMYYTSLFTQHFKFDDVYLGIVAKKCGISPLHNEYFYFWKEPYTKEDYSHVIASHGYDNPEELKLVWNEQRSLGHA